MAPAIAVSGRLIWEGPPSVERDPLVIVLNGADHHARFRQQGASDNAGQFHALRSVRRPVSSRFAGQSKDCFVKAVRSGATDGLEDGFNVAAVLHPNAGPAR